MTWFSIKNESVKNKKKNASYEKGEKGKERSRASKRGGTLLWISIYLSYGINPLGDLISILISSHETVFYTAYWRYCEYFKIENASEVFVIKSNKA